MKKLLLLIITLGSATALTGCTDRTEINEFLEAVKADNYQISYKQAWDTYTYKLDGNVHYYSEIKYTGLTQSTTQFYYDVSDEDIVEYYKVNSTTWGSRDFSATNNDGESQDRDEKYSNPFEYVSANLLKRVKVKVAAVYEEDENGNFGDVLEEAYSYYAWIPKGLSYEQSPYQISFNEDGTVTIVLGQKVLTYSDFGDVNLTLPI